jgi:hypothetical protein
MIRLVVCGVTAFVIMAMAHGAFPVLGTTAVVLAGINVTWGYIIGALLFWFMLRKLEE